MPTLKITFLESDSSRSALFSTHEFLSLMVGRSPDSEISFADERFPMVSRNHAAIEWDEDVANTLSISDIQSANGTYVNGTRIEDTVRLKSGDVIQLGETGPEIRIEVTEDEIARDSKAANAVPKRAITAVTTAFPGETELEFEARLAVWRDRQAKKRQDES